MNPYPSYNDSGVEWIGKVPNEWSIVKYKSLGENIVDNIGTEDFKDKKVIHYSIPNVQSFGKGVMELGNDIKSSKLLFKGGELIISKLNPRKSTVCIVEEFEDNIILGSGEFVVLYPKIMDSKYLYYFVITSKYTDFLDSCVESVTRSHQRVNPSIIYNSYIPNPSEIEQTQIVSFLDTKTQKIDELIEKTEQKIELLKEKRTSLINHCVTKGLNPNVEMKDSGVEWIGEIPRDWDSLPLKYFGQVTLGKMLTPEDKGGYFLKPYLRSKNIQIEKVNILDLKEMWFSENELNRLRLKKGDLLFNEGGDVGRTCQWNEEINECYIQNSVNRVRLPDDNERYYLHLSILYHSEGYYDSLVNRVSIPHLTKEKLESVKFLRPPLSEQTQIVEYLDEQTQKIDTTIEKETQRIELLKEYRQSLISEVVTGKVDVRDYNG